MESLTIWIQPLGKCNVCNSMKLIKTNRLGTHLVDQTFGISMIERCKMVKIYNVKSIVFQANDRMAAQVAYSCHGHNSTTRVSHSIEGKRKFMQK